VRSRGGEEGRKRRGKRRGGEGSRDGNEWMGREEGKEVRANQRGYKEWERRRNQRRGIVI
jgi:hypothetical protein